MSEVFPTGEGAGNSWAIAHAKCESSPAHPADADFPEQAGIDASYGGTLAGEIESAHARDRLANSAKHSASAIPSCGTRQPFKISGTIGHTLRQ